MRQLDLTPPDKLDPAERVRRLNVIRASILANEEISQEEIRYGIDLLRVERTVRAQPKDDGSGVKKGKPSAISIDDM